MSSVSSELYEVLSLAARYLFALLGVLIVLRSFFWLLSERAERRRTVRRMPWSGTVGELVVVSGSRDLPEGTVIPVPWEGVLGSVRSSDLFIPCAGVRRKHLSFVYEQGTGLLIHPFSGCEAAVGSAVLDCRSRPEDTPAAHGAFLQVGQAVLRLRVYAALDSAAGFDSVQENASARLAPETAAPPGGPRTPAGEPAASPLPFPQQPAPGFPPEPCVPGWPAVPSPPEPSAPGWSDVPSPPESSAPGWSDAPSLPEAAVRAPSPEVSPAVPSAPPRRRRSVKWEEADWSD